MPELALEGALHQAIQKSDGNGVVFALVTRDQQQLSLIEKTYDQQYEKGAFRAGIDDLKRRDQLSVETILNHVDGQTNYADSLKRLDPSNKNGKDLSYQLLNVFSAVKPEQLHQIATDFAKRSNGTQLTDAIAQNKTLSAQVKSALLDYVLKDSGSLDPSVAKSGSPERSAQDDLALVKLAISLQKENSNSLLGQTKPNDLSWHCCIWL